MKPMILICTVLSALFGYANENDSISSLPFQSYVSTKSPQLSLPEIDSIIYHNLSTNFDFNLKITVG